MEFRKLTNENCTPQKINHIVQKFGVSKDVAELLLLRELNSDAEIAKKLQYSTIQTVYKK